MIIIEFQNDIIIDVDRTKISIYLLDIFRNAMMLRVSGCHLHSFSCPERWDRALPQPKVT